MNTQQYDLSENYRLHVTVSDAHIGKHLLIESQWADAKNPSGRQKRFELTASAATLDAIGRQICRESNNEPAVQRLPADDTEGGAA